MAATLTTAMAATLTAAIGATLTLSAAIRVSSVINRKIGDFFSIQGPQDFKVIMHR